MDAGDCSSVAPFGGVLDSSVVCAAASNVGAVRASVSKSAAQILDRFMAYLRETEACHRTPAPALKLRSAAYERQQFRVDDIGVRRAHAVREARVYLQRTLLEMLDGQRRRVGERHNLVVIAVHDQHRDCLLYTS